MKNRDPALRGIVDSWFAALLVEGITKNVNTMARFLTLAYRYEEKGDRTLLLWLGSGAKWAMRSMRRAPHGGMQHITLAEENHHSLWHDTLMTTVLPLDAGTITADGETRNGVTPLPSSWHARPTCTRAGLPAHRIRALSQFTKAAE